MEPLSESDTLIRDYFRLGLQQAEILALLISKHSIVLSERQLKRRLKVLGLTRRLNFSDINQVTTFIQAELGRSGQLHGYKWMHLKCIQAGLVVKQSDVRLILKDLDPLGVAIRSHCRLRRRVYRNKGPNFLWHMDAYDKLKPYGICIHGCIDGFSRHIMWLEAGATSSDPKVVAGYFIKTVESVGGVPVRIRADFGTENRSVEQMQVFLREKEDAPLESAWLYGTSQLNQRIESWWSILRKHQAQFWMNLFHNLKDVGVFCGTFLDKALIQFVFMKMIQAELDTVVAEWNTHRISKSRNAVAPAGKPVILYNVPEIYGAKNYLRMCDEARLNTCKEECIFSNEIVSDEDVYELCNIIIQEENLQLPNDDPYKGVDLYTDLRSKINYMV